jgi:hypothetical protein
MPEIANPVTATMNVLSASATVTTAMGGTSSVYGGEIPKGQIASMPKRAAVVAAAGTPGIGPGTADNVPVSVSRVDVRCYGRTREEADVVALAVAHALKAWDRGQTSGRHHVHWFHRTAGPVPLRDPDTDWPISVVTFQLQMADELAPA